MTVHIELPIDADKLKRAETFINRALKRAKDEKARPVLIFHFEVPTDQEEFARSTNFFNAAAMARAIVAIGQKSDAARTVAYVPRAITGHAVLVAMACDEIVMAGDANFGPVDAKPETIGPTERSAYQEIAASRNTIPADVALWLLDPSLEVLSVETDAGGSEYVTRQRLEELRQKRTITSEEPLLGLAEGQPRQFTGEEGRQLGFVARKVATPEDVARWLKLPRDVMNEDRSLTGDWQGVLIVLKGPISKEAAGKAQKRIEKLDGDVNFICLQIDSGGGSPLHSIELAKTLSGLDRHEIRTVAYIPAQARSDAALIALACHEVLMGPRATLGGSGDYHLNRDEIDEVRTTIRESKGIWNAPSWALVAAMIDPDLVVVP